MWRVGAKTREGKRKKERETFVGFVCCSESKKTKGEDEERRRREKTFLPELRFFLVSIVGFSFVVRRYVFILSAFLHYGNRFVVFFSKVIVVGFLVKELRFFFGFRRHSQVTYCLKTNLTSMLYR